ncbi:MAG TPA: CHAD domain-containing protein, partial [Chitinophagaceae bacterium]
NITAIFRSQIHNVSSAFYQLMKDFDIDANHDFRTAIKKLRAFVRLTNLSLPDTSNKIPRRIRSFYHAAGDLRNLQLHARRLTEICRTMAIDEPGAYQDALADQQEFARKKMKDAAETLSPDNFEKLCKHTPPALHAAMKRRFVRDNIGRLVGLLALPFLTDELLHEVRKIIKDLVYNYECLASEIKFLVPSPLNRLEFMEDITQKLGDLQDLRMALMFLAPPFRSSAVSEARQLAEVRRHVQLSRDNLRNELLTVLIDLKPLLSNAGYSVNVSMAT